MTGLVLSVVVRVHFICFTVGEWETFLSIPCMSDMQEIDNKATLTLTFDFDDACGCTACARRICVCVPSYVWYMCECHVCVPVSAYLCACRCNPRLLFYNG